jgi:hypothetical protein
MNFSLPIHPLVPRASLFFIVLALGGCSGAAAPSTAPNGGIATQRTAASSGGALNSTVKTASKPSKFRFTERTQGAGIDWTYRNGDEAERFAILESLGGGVAAFDFDRDRRDDLYFTGGGRYAGERALEGLPGGLFQNRGDWEFRPVSESANLIGARHYSHGAIAGDFDSDGFSDLLITGYGGLQLWHNQGDGTFADATDGSGLVDAQWSSSAGWGDLNGDGALDLYVAHYVNWSFDNDPLCPAPPPHQREVCPPRTFEAVQHAVYFSNGDGTFRDVSQEAGLRSDGKGLGVLLCDLDLDGDLDVYVANDTVENHLYENLGDGKFADVSLLSGTALSDRGIPDGSMGVDLFDFNHDGLPDIWVTNFERENCALYQNMGKMLFRHVSQPTGITAVGGMYVGWGTSCFDIDLDGDEDILVANGHVIRYPTNAPLRQLPLLFENAGGTWFRNVAEQAGEYTRSPHMGRGVATSDLDGDGDLDVAISHVNEPAAVLANDTPHAGHWFAVELVGTRSPRDPIGAVVTVTTASGSQSRHLRGGGSYASTNSRRLHFGLGTAQDIQKVEIRWPSQARQTIVAPTMDQALVVVEADER